jgi:hypothetical protein
VTTIAGPEGERLRRAALAGDTAAQREWGKLLLSLQPPNYRDGLPNITKAAEGGDGEASYVLARYAAASSGDLSGGLVHLARAAERGWEPAIRELAFLSRGGASPDVDELLRAPAPQIHSSAPRIATIAGFLPWNATG